MVDPNEIRRLTAERHMVEQRLGLVGRRMRAMTLHTREYGDLEAERDRLLVEQRRLDATLAWCRGDEGGSGIAWITTGGPGRIAAAGPPGARDPRAAQYGHTSERDDESSQPWWRFW